MALEQEKTAHAAEFGPCWHAFGDSALLLVCAFHSSGINVQLAVATARVALDISLAKWIPAHMQVGKRYSQLKYSVVAGLSPSLFAAEYVPKTTCSSEVILNDYAIGRYFPLISDFFCIQQCD